MPLLGEGAIAMWWDMAAAKRAEFEDWHSHEHFPERVSLPGVLRASRWRSAKGDDGFFVLYEHRSYETLTSPQYLARLNDPTPWSIKLMPHHRNMVRSQCHVAVSHGSVIGGALMTLRISPAPGRAEALEAHLDSRLGPLVQRPGSTGGHLLITRTKPAAPTKEQMIRGGGVDAAADWIVLICGYAVADLEAMRSAEFGAESLVDAGALPEQTVSLLTLAHEMRQTDL